MSRATCVMPVRWLLVLAVAFSVSLACFTQPAFATTLGEVVVGMPGTPVTTFTGHSPAPDAVYTTRPPGVFVSAACTVPLVKTGALCYVDGVSRRLTMVTPYGPSGHWQYTLVYDEEEDEDYWVTTWVLDPDLTRTQAFASGQTPGTDGTHTVSVTLKNSKGITATENWSYGVRIAPTLGAPLPAAGSLVTTLTPVIQIPAADNSAVTTWTVSVNGIPAGATLSAGKLRVIPSKPLEDDALNTVTVLVADAIGVSAERTWSFNIQVRPEMDASSLDSCESCHVDKSLTHNKMVDCGPCHGDYHGATPTQIHAPADVSDCRPCHVSALTVEHAQYALNCLSCHYSTAPAVVSAVAAGDSSCAGCHDLGVAHPGHHATEVPVACTGPGCHVGTDLAALHVNEQTPLGCASCHRSDNTDVAAAISADVTDCFACHFDPHPEGGLVIDHLVAEPSCTAVGCHTGAGDLAEIHATQGCVTCHDVGMTPTADCTSGGCHLSMDDHADAPAIHETQTEFAWMPFFTEDSDHAIDGAGATDVYASCDMCHSSDSLLVVHNNDCATCHAGPTPPAGSFPVWNHGCSQGACHPTYHAGATAGHDRKYEMGSGDCSTCHAFVGWRGYWDGSAYPEWCGICHTVN